MFFSEPSYTRRWQRRERNPILCVENGKKVFASTDAEIELAARHCAMPCVRTFDANRKEIDPFSAPLSERTREMIAMRGKERSEAMRAEIRRQYREYQAERDAKGSGARRERNGMPIGAFRNEETELHYRLRAVGAR